MAKPSPKSNSLHQWHCPEKNVLLLKLETCILAIILIIVFIFSFAVFDQSWLLAAASSLLFLIIFFTITYLLRRHYPISELYQVTKQGLKIEKRVKNKVKKDFVKFTEIKKFKLDKFFHGGRLETKNKRHSLYFNSRQEVEKLERILKKKVKTM